LRELKKSHSAFERLHANHFGHEKNVDMASSPEEMRNEVIENQDIEEESNVYFKNHLNCSTSAQSANFFLNAWWLKSN